jgi:hypothetical protein
MIGQMSVKNGTIGTRIFCPTQQTLVLTWRNIEVRRHIPHSIPHSFQQVYNSRR